MSLCSSCVSLLFFPWYRVPPPELKCLINPNFKKDINHHVSCCAMVCAVLLLISPTQELPGEALLPGDIVSVCRPKGGPGAEDMVVPAGLCMYMHVIICIQV